MDKLQYFQDQLVNLEAERNSLDETIAALRRFILGFDAPEAWARKPAARRIGRPRGKRLSKDEVRKIITAKTGQRKPFRPLKPGRAAQGETYADIIGALIRQQGRPMKTREIIDTLERRGQIRPETRRNLLSIIGMTLRGRKGKSTRFLKVAPGMWGLREEEAA